MEAINAFAARHTDLRLNMAVIPNAACILADKLPKNAPVRDQSADLTALAGSLQGISFLDVSGCTFRSHGRAALLPHGPPLDEPRRALCL